MEGLSALFAELDIISLVMYTAIGVTVGLIVSGLPGLSGALAVIVMLPLTSGLNLLDGLGMLIGAYKAVQFGGSIPAATMNMPGTPESAAATADMYALTRKGYPKRSLGVALHAGTIGDLVADIVVLAALPALAAVALAFGTRELLSVAVLAVFVLPSAVTGAPLKSVVAIMLGMALSMVGTDPITGISRLTFSLPALRGGIDVVAMVVGALAMAVVMDQLSAMVVGRKHAGVLDPVESEPDDRTSWRYVWDGWRELLVGSGLGVFLGILPGPGATMAAYSAYGVTSRWKRNAGTFGTGNSRGIVAAEVANNATVGPGFVPLLAFGIPGTVVSGIIGGAFLMHGLTPGPGLFRQQPGLLYGFILILVLATLINWPLGQLFISAYRLVPAIRTEVLMSVVAILLVVATYGFRNNVYDIYVMLAFGLLGLGMTKTGYPVAPMVVAFLIGPILETQLRRALQAGGGDWGYLLSSGTAVTIYLVMLALLAGMALMRRGRRLAPTDDEPSSSEDDQEPAVISFEVE